MCAYWKEHDRSSGLNLLKAGSWTQGTGFKRVAESELYAGVMIGFSDGAGQCAFDTDSSLAKSIMERRGLARIKHLHCPMLWLQERVNSGEIHTEKRRGEHNTASVGTDAVNAEVQRRYVKKLKVEWREGRHPFASRAVL